MTTISDPVLDHILALQLTVAWAGEAQSEPPRLGWWQTDLVDERGGGDFFKRLAPRTHRWAALEAVREAARRVDLKARRGTSNADQIRSLYHLGFEVDEQLDLRLAQHRREERAPSAALPDLYPIEDGFDRARLEDHLRGDAPVDYRVTPAGRLLKGDSPESLELLMDKLASALLPLSDSYTLPHLLVKE